MGIISRIEN